MRITVMGVFIVIGVVLVLAFVVNTVQPGSNETGKSNDRPNFST